VAERTEHMRDSVEEEEREGEEGREKEEERKECMRRGSV